MKKIYFLLVFCFCSAATTLIAQQKEKKITTKDSLQIEKYQQQIKTLKNEKKYSEMIKVREDLSVFLEKKKYWGKYFDNKYDLARIYGLRLNDKKEEQRRMQELLKEMQEKKYQNDIIYTEVNFSIACDYLEQKDSENTKKYFYITKDLCEKNHPEDYLLGDVYNNLMAFYSNGKNKNIDSIDFYLDKSFAFLKRIHKKDQNKEVFARYYQNKGASLTGEINNHKKALVYLTQSNKIYKNLLSKKKEDIFLIEGYLTSFISLGDCYNHLKEYEQANSNYLSAIEYLKVIKIDLINEIILYSNVAKNNVKLSEKIKNKDKKDSLLNEASNFLNKGIDLCINKENYQDMLSGDYIDMANVLIKQGKLEEANGFFQKSENILKKIWKANQKNDDLAYLYSNWAVLFEKKENTNFALKLYQKAIFYGTPIAFQDSINIYANPNKEILKNIKNSLLLSILRSKAGAFFKIAQNTNLKQDWEHTFNTYQLVSDFFEMMLDKKNDSDKLQFIQEQESTYENILHVCFELKDYVSFFKYLEKYKANLLLAQTAQNENAKNINTKTLQQEEKNIKKNITQLDGELAKSPDDKILQERYFQRNLKLDSLVKIFEKQEPEYFSLRYQTNTISLEETQNKLAENQAFIQYVMANDYLYTMAVTNKKSHIQKIQISEDSLQNKVYLYRKYLRETGKTDSLLKMSMNLHKILIEPILPFIKDKKHWIIIPHQSLFEINFEVLFDKLPISTRFDKNKKILPATFEWDKVEYLLHKYIISSHLSATLIFDDKLFKNQIQNTQNDILIIAPIYENKEKGSIILPENLPIIDEVKAQNKFIKGTKGISENGKNIDKLEHSKIEVFKIDSIFKQNNKKSSLLLEENATETKLKQEGKNAKIIHLSTHSFFHARDYRLSAITFWQPDSLIYKQSYDKEKQATIDDGMLFGNEIYTLDLPNTSLVVLSSCEGGLGSIIAGEGPMAITRGFMYAGVPNLVYSISKVPDLHTSKLMPLFYKYIFLGKSYAEALNLAKKEFIKTYKNDAFLGNWADFIIMQR